MENNRFQLEYYQYLFDVEHKFMAKPGYFKSYYAKFLRRKAIYRLEIYSRSDNFDAFIPYLAITYFDRLISRRKPDKMLKIEKASGKLFLICCLSIAWKTRTREFKLPVLLETIKKSYTDSEVLEMETFILKELDWQMRPATPICFADYYMNNFLPQAKHLIEAHQLVKAFIIAAQADIRTTKYKPSVIAACAVTEIANILFPQFVPQFRDALSGSCESAKKIQQQVNDNRVELADISKRIMQTLAVPSTFTPYFPLPAPAVRSVTTLQTLLDMSSAADLSPPLQIPRKQSEIKQSDLFKMRASTQEDKIPPAESPDKAAEKHLRTAGEERRAGKRPVGEAAQEDEFQSAESPENEAAKKLREAAEERRIGKKPVGEVAQEDEFHSARSTLPPAARSLTTLQTLLEMPPEADLSSPLQMPRKQGEIELSDLFKMTASTQEDEIPPAESPDKAAEKHLQTAAEERRAGKRPVGEAAQEDEFQSAESPENEAAKKLREAAEERRLGKRPVGEAAQEDEFHSARSTLPPAARSLTTLQTLLEMPPAADLSPPLQMPRKQGEIELSDLFKMTASTQEDEIPPAETPAKAAENHLRTAAEEKIAGKRPVGEAAQEDEFMSAESTLPPATGSLTTLQRLVDIPPAAEPSSPPQMPQKQGKIKLSDLLKMTASTQEDEIPPAESPAKAAEKHLRTAFEERRLGKRPVREAAQEYEVKPADSPENEATKKPREAAEERRLGKRPIGEAAQEDEMQPPESPENEVAKKIRAAAEKRRAGKRPMEEKPINHEIEPSRDKTDDNGQLVFALKWAEYQESHGVSGQDYCVAGLCAWWYKITALFSRRSR